MKKPPRGWVDASPWVIKRNAIKIDVEDGTLLTGGRGRPMTLRKLIERESGQKPYDAELRRIAGDVARHLGRKDPAKSSAGKSSGAARLNSSKKRRILDAAKDRDDTPRARRAISKATSASPRHVRRVLKK